MPLYEYRCQGCRRRITLLVRSPSQKLACPQCGGQELSRLFSTFAVKRSYMDDYEDILSDSQLVRGLEHDDPQALSEWNRRMSRTMDESPSPEQEEMLERMDAGEMPRGPVGEGAGEPED